MCAIFGVFSGSSVESVRSKFENCLAFLRHRGPDGSRSVKTENCSMSQSLLSITRFPPVQDQPRFLRSGKVCFSFNGEIYNYKKLKARYRLMVPLDFNDTDVFCALLEMFDLAEAIDLIDGVYAFAIYDLEKRELTLGRDPLGEKPLYFRLDGDFFWYSSELVGVSNNFFPKLTFDRHFFHSFLSLGFTSKKAFEMLDVNQITPGDVVRFRFHEKVLKQDLVHRKVSLSFKLSHRGLRDKFVESFVMAVDEMTSCPVRGAISLSSGLDSSLIAAALNRLGRRLTAFHFDTGIGGEASSASKIAKACNLELVMLSETERMIDDYLSRIGDTCLPMFDPSEVYFSSICSAAAEQDCRYVLTGDGGDELFSKYKRHRVQKYRQLLKLIPDCVVDILFANKFGKDLSFVDRILFESISSEKVPWPPVCSKSYIGLPEPGSDTKDTADIATWDFENFLPYNGFMKTERTAMRHGLEARLPLLRSQIVAFSGRACTNTSGFNKADLRYALKKLNPSAELEASRIKKGFDPSVRFINKISRRVPVNQKSEAKEVLDSWNPLGATYELSHSLRIKLYLFNRWCEIHHAGFLSK